MIILFSIHLLASICLCYWILELVPFVPETAGGAIIAFFFSITLLWLICYLFNKRYFKLVVQIMYLCKYFVKEFIRSNIRLTKEIITPKINLHPAVVKVPLHLRTDVGVMVLTNISNLTPGTLVVGISDDRKHLFVHTIYLEGGTLETFKTYMSDGLEKRLLNISSLLSGEVEIQTSGDGDSDSITKIKNSNKK